MARGEGEGSESSMVMSDAVFSRLSDYIHEAMGIKMVLSDIYKIPIGISLGVVGLIIVVSIAASLMWPKERAQQ